HRRRPFVCRGWLGARDGCDTRAPSRSKRMDSRKFIRDRHRPPDQCDRRARILVLMIKEISPQEFFLRRTAGTEMILLDVREGWETELAPVPSRIVHIPMGEIANRLG